MPRTHQATHENESPTAHFTHNPTTHPPHQQDEAKASSTVEFKGPMPEVGTVFRDVEIKGVQNFGVFVEILPGLQVKGFGG